MVNGRGRTGSDARFRPKNRHLSRYGMIEDALNKMKADEITTFKLCDVSGRIRKMQDSEIKGILHFTNGIGYDRKKRMYHFDGGEIRVDAG